MIDLHCHYLPAVDDGVKTEEEGVTLLRELRQLGYETVIATPHMRTSMFPNDRATLVNRFEAFQERHANIEGLPELGLGSEHFFDDVFWTRFEAGEVLPYPGGRSILVELSPHRFPLGLDRAFFQMNVRGIAPVLAHPERYEPLYRNTRPLGPLLETGVLPLLDLMSLAGKYGRRPKAAAERMVEEGTYFAACSDCHRPTDVPVVAKALDALRNRIGSDATDQLVADGPRRILEGDF